MTSKETQALAAHMITIEYLLVDLIASKLREKPDPIACAEEWAAKIDNDLANYPLAHALPAFEAYALSAELEEAGKQIAKAVFSRLIPQTKHP